MAQKFPLRLLPAEGCAVRASASSTYQDAKCGNSRFAIASWCLCTRCSWISPAVISKFIHHRPVLLTAAPRKRCSFALLCLCDADYRYVKDQRHRRRKEPTNHRIGSHGLCTFQALVSGISSRAGLGGPVTWNEFQARRRRPERPGGGGNSSWTKQRAVPEPCLICSQRCRRGGPGSRNLGTRSAAATGRSDRARSPI